MRGLKLSVARWGGFFFCDNKVKLCAELQGQEFHFVCVSAHLSHT